MKRTSQTNDHKTSGTNWQLFGEFSPPAGSATNEMIRTWLVNTLRPLNLNEQLINKILASADFAPDANNPSADVKTMQQIHLLIYTPASIPQAGLTWGFFRIEKKEDPSHSHLLASRTFIFYLYLEGK